MVLTPYIIYTLSPEKRVEPDTPEKTKGKYPKRVNKTAITKILEVNLFAFAYRLFHEDFSPNCNHICSPDCNHTFV